MKNSLFITMILLSALVISACTTTPPATTVQSTTSTVSDGQIDGDVKEIRVEAYNFGFDVTGPEINVGDRVRIIATSREGTHGIAIPAYNVNLKPLSPGEEKSAEFVADQAGSFDYFCNVPCGEGHKSMRGQIVVS